MMDSQQRFLFLLKTHGALSTQRVGEKLGMTKEAARQMLHKLAGDGSVRSTTSATGVGRPQKVWELTDQAQALFPDTHSELTVQLIEHIRQVFGEAGLKQIILAQEAATLHHYRSRIQEQDPLLTKVQKLAEIRAEEGYMAQWEETEDGFLLVENHCPICAAATACQGFCQAEMSTFQAILGAEVSIERTDHIVSGARRCAYRIKSAHHSA